MTYQEYCEATKHVPISDELEFFPSYFWPHPTTLSLADLVSVGNSGLSVVKVPETAINKFGRAVPVAYIARRAFAGNQTVTDIILPASIKSLPAGAFAGCTNLRNITIPRSVKTIPEKTFEGCTRLVNVFYEGTPEEWDAVRIVRDRHVVEFGDCIPGTPVNTIVSERRDHIPGNEPLFAANIHFRCPLTGGAAPDFRITLGGKDVTGLFRTEPLCTENGT